MKDRREKFLNEFAELLRRHNAQLVGYTDPISGGSAYRVDLLEPEGKRLPIARSWLFESMRPRGLAGFDRSPEPA